MSHVSQVSQLTGGFMTVIPKHEVRAPRQGIKQPQTNATTLNLPDLTVGLGGIETALDTFRSVVSTYVKNSWNGENRLELYTGDSSCPLRVQLESEAIHSVAAQICAGNDQLERIASAFERIATAIES